MPPAEPTIRAVVFDLDDTLYAEREYVRGGYRAVGRYARERLGREGAFEDWLWGRFCAGRRDRAFDAMSAEFGLDLTAAEIAELVTVYREHRPVIRPRPGVEALLARLGKLRKLGLLSDGFLPAQRLKLEALGLGRFFDAVIYTEEMGRDCWKPSPAGFEAIRRALDVAHAACAYVGDNPAKDFVAPNALGWRTIRLLCGGQVHAEEPAAPDGEPHVTIAGLHELEAALG
jgi:putative hydrolase of the HAD superfamily